MDTWWNFGHELKKNEWGGEPGADNDEDDGPEVALFEVHSDSDDSSVSDDDDIVAILDEKEVF